MNDEVLQLLGRLLRMRRVTALGTLREGSPLVSMVAYALEPETPALLIHISGLAYHTQDLLGDPRVGMLVMEEDSAMDGGRDPQTLARVSLRGMAERIERDDATYSLARERYLERFPAAEPLFSFGDFGLFRIRVLGARFVAGFAQTYNLSADQVREALAED